MEYVRKFLRNLLSHLDLINALHRHYGSLSFSSREFSDIARRIGGEDINTDPAELFTRLLQQEVLIPVARSESHYDLNPAVLDIIELVTDQQQLGLSGSLQAKIDDLHRLTSQLGQSLDSADTYLFGRYISQLDRRFRDVHRELQQNEQAILRIIEEAKNTGRNIPLKTRYAQALDTWNQYVQPTADMLDVQGDYELTLKNIEHKLLEYRDRARHSIGFDESSRLDKLNLRLLDLRSGLRLSIQRCTRLLEPIYRRFQRNSELTRGASIAIAEMRRSKFRYAKTPAQVQLTGRTRPSLTDSDSSLVAYLSELSVLEQPNYDIPDTCFQAAQQPVTFNMVNEAIASELPVDDCLGWLTDNYPQLDTRQILEYLTRLTSETEQLTSLVADETPRQYETASHIITMQRRTLQQASGQS